MTQMAELGLQFGFVALLLAGATFVVDELGGEEAIPRKGLQVVIALVVTVTVFTVTGV